MMPCCELCYEKYIDEDGKIDWSVLYPLQMKHPVVLKEGEERDVCRCQCHIKGVQCLH